ncbi:hypothetical protein B0H14DRAFT_3505410 [Mycena olivaceomarginata]|nr:hypothetical protein B0H14DRAFT_3505410 [Mycena olivaceomarginata]
MTAPSKTPAEKISRAAAKPGKGKKTTADKDSGKKAGNPGKFKGARLKFLETQLPLYLAQKGRNTVTEWYNNMFPLWWAQFPWYEGYGPDGKPLREADTTSGTPDAFTASATTLSATTDRTSALDATTPAPDTTTTAPDATTTAPDVTTTAPDTTTIAPDATTDGTANAPAVPPGQVGAPTGFASTGGVNPAFENSIKTDIIAQVKTWFSHKKTTANHLAKNPWVDWLNTYERPHMPRKLQLHKYYMQLEEYAGLVEERFKQKWDTAGLEARFALDFRCKCAKELLDEEDDEVRATIASALDAEHEKALAEYNGRVDAMANPDEPDAAKMEACRQNLATVAQPFLDGVAKLTGLHVTLIAGAGPPPGSERFTLTTLHAGRTFAFGGVPGKKFSEWDVPGFKKNVLGQFMRFLMETNEC